MTLLRVTENYTRYSDYFRRVSAVVSSLVSYYHRLGRWLRGTWLLRTRTLYGPGEQFCATSVASVSLSRLPVSERTVRVYPLLPTSDCKKGRNRSCSPVATTGLSDVPPFGKQGERVPVATGLPIPTRNPWTSPTGTTLKTRE